MATNILGSAKTFTEYPTFTMAHKHQYLGADVGDIEHLGARSMVTPWVVSCHVSVGSWQVAGGECEHHGPSL